MEKMNITQIHFDKLREDLISMGANQQLLEDVYFLFSNSSIIQLQKSFFLYQNKPNPFNPATLISFSIPEQIEITLNIYNLRGCLIRTLCNKVFEVGKHQILWDGRDEFGHNVSSGVYFYSMKAGNYSQIRKMVFLK